MKFGVKHQACGVEEFVSKGVAIQRLILEQGRMQADGDLARVKAKAATTNEFVAALLKTGSCPSGRRLHRAHWTVKRSAIQGKNTAST